jgi:proliferating cell nuclear antigen
MSRVLEIKTVQSGLFKFCVEALKEILTDANWEFDSNGVKIMALDPSHTVFVHTKMEAEKFESYKCVKKKLISGISMLNLFKLIKTIGNNSTLTLFVETNDESKLGICIEDHDKNVSTTFYLSLLDLDESRIQAPSPKFNTILTIPSADFQKYCREMNNLADIMEIKSVGKQLILSCTGDFATQTTVLGETTNGMSYMENSTDDIVQGYFQLKFLVLFSKCANLCSNVKLYLENDLPLVCEYCFNLGTIKFALAPKIVD